MSWSVEGKVAVVTGGSRGIGWETTRILIEHGAVGVVFTSRRPENIDSAVAGLVDAGVSRDSVLGVPARADDDEASDRTMAAAIERFGAIDILVNNAGTNPSAGALMDVEMGAVDKTWAVNQRAPLVWSRAAYRAGMHDSGGVIVNIASVGGVRPAPMIGAYNISKAALIHLTHQLALELAPSIRVNAVAPGVVKTRLSELLWTADESAAAAMHPLGSLGEPLDVANAVLYLCSAEARWLTGVILPVDGGVLGAAGTLA